MVKSIQWEALVDLANTAFKIAAHDNCGLPRELARKLLDVAVIFGCENIHLSDEPFDVKEAP